VYIGKDNKAYAKNETFKVMSTVAHNLDCLSLEGIFEEDQKVIARTIVEISAKQKNLQTSQRAMVGTSEALQLELANLDSSDSKATEATLKRSSDNAQKLSASLATAVTVSVLHRCLLYCN